MSKRWRISELGEAVFKALEHIDYESSNNGQISSVPNARTIRYYTTLGLIDGPAEMRGRTAFYDRWHLVQLVAIKRLQSSGKSLAEVQELLQGAQKSKIESIADLQGFTFEGSKAGAPESTAESKKKRNDEAFWEQDHNDASFTDVSTEPLKTRTEIVISPDISIVVAQEFDNKTLDNKTRLALINKANELLALLAHSKDGDS